MHTTDTVVTPDSTTHTTGETVHGVRRELEVRHMVMLALGGVIGSGLFISSGYTITQAGPLGTVLAYLVGAAVAFMVMACMGELAVQYPEAGGFHVYAYKAISPAAGFTTAWLYWLCWVAALGSELTASGLLMQRWFPQVDVWVWSLVFAAVLFGINAFSVRGFGEAEFWFSLVKVIAVVVLIVVGAAAILGFGNGDEPAPLFHNFHTPDGYFPTGFGGVIITILAVFYAFSGTELIAIAAGEAKDPNRSVPKALHTTLFRLLVFFVGAIIVIAALIPWEQLQDIGGDESVENSPFVLVFEQVGIPYADDIMAGVIIVALLSAGNSGLYACSRLLYSMAKMKQLPTIFGKTTTRGVPLFAITVSLIAGLAALVSSVVSPGAVYLALVSIAGFAVVAVWMVIVVAQMRNRSQYLASGSKLEDLVYRTPFYPALPIATLLILAISLVAVAFDPSQVAALYFGIPFVGLCYLVHWAMQKRAERSAPASSGSTHP